MGQARLNDFLLLRQRPEKALRSHGRYVGNLGAFGKAGAAMTHGCALDPEKARSSHIHWPKSKLAVLIGGTTIGGAALGAMLWMPFTSGASNDVVAPSNTVRTAEAEAPSKRQATTIPPTSRYLEQQNQTKHANEINQLHSQILNLQNKVEALTGETLDLNVELFQLELHLQGLEDQPTETRVVYNFVNVPLGKTIESTAPLIPVVDLAESSIADSYSNDPTPELVLLQEVAYGSDNGFYLNSRYPEDGYEEEYEDSDEPVTSDDHRRIVYPPISSE